MSHVIDIGNLFRDIDLSAGLVAIIISYILGFAADTPGTWLYYGVACRIWGQPCVLREQTKPDLNKKRVLVRQYSPENFSYVQLWKAMKTMSHNLAFAALVIAVVAGVRSFQVTSPARAEWLLLVLVAVLSGFAFLHRAQLFDRWHYRDLTDATEVLHLDTKALIENGVEPRTKKTPVVDKAP